MSRTPVDVAREYIERGWAPIPVPYRSKNPGRNGWQNERLTVADVGAMFNQTEINVGVLLGTPSGNLVDVDLDTPEAVVLAPAILPNTLMFGRSAKRRSHYLYKSDPLSKTIKFQDPTRTQNGDRRMLLELRSTGCQTVFPGSVHECGEPIEWDEETASIATITGDSLLQRVGVLAAATLLARHWPAEGARQDAALALAGGLIRARWAVNDVARFTELVARAAGDDEAEKRGTVAQYTRERYAAGEPVVGWPRLATIIDQRVVKRVREWMHRGTPENTDATTEGTMAISTGGNGDLTKPQILAKLLRDDGVHFVRTPTGRAFALVHSTAFACDSAEFVRWCSALFWRARNETISESTITALINALTGMELPTQQIPVRVGGDMVRITIDLGGSVVALTAATIEPAPDAVFVRPPGSRFLPVPIMPESDAQAASTMEEFRCILGIEVRAWAACIAWLLAALRPGAPYPILLLRGEHGSGKSTLARALRAVIDPHHPELGTLPDTPRDLAIRAEHHHVVAIDNVSSIPGELSDALCRLATGDGLETRSLYTDRDLAVFDVARPVVLTSIVDAATRPDLLDRALIVDLPTRTDRREDDEICAALEAIKPRVLGALLYAVRRALAGDDVAVDPAVRMRGPAVFAARAAPALGFSVNDVEGAYMDSRAVAHGVAADDPMVDAIVEFMASRESWTGTMTDLFRDLRPHGQFVPLPEGWPKTPRGLSAVLRRLAPTLRACGVQYTTPDGREGRDKSRVHRLNRNVK